MRIKRKPKPIPPIKGEKRKFTKFIIFPRFCESTQEWVFLETVMYTQKYIAEWDEFQGILDEFWVTIDISPITK